MQKYLLQNLDCANCAAKIENAVQKTPGVNFASVDFATTTLFLDTVDLAAVKQTIWGVEPEVKILEKTEKVPDEGSFDVREKLNPILFAGWVGLLLTSINLLPAGQLDGGHIFRAVLGEKQKYAGWGAIFIMILTGWWFFAFIIIFMMGMMHPPPLNDDTEIDIKRKMLFFVALAILILCYIPFPIYVAP